MSWLVSSSAGKDLAAHSLINSFILKSSSINYIKRLASYFQRQTNSPMLYLGFEVADLRIHQHKPGPLCISGPLAQMARGPVHTTAAPRPSPEKTAGAVQGRIVGSLGWEGEDLSGSSQ